jgi:CubicO group peptidase (beta-lactamase class C family)
MSKTVVGMAVGVLADRGLIDIDAPVSAYFPEYTFRDRRGEGMRVAHLLSMRSGVSLGEVGLSPSPQAARAKSMVSARMSARIFFIVCTPLFFYF